MPELLERRARLRAYKAGAAVAVYHLRVVVLIRIRESAASSKGQDFAKDFWRALYFANNSKVRRLSNRNRTCESRLIRYG
jgi:hypothetical protein